MKKNQLVAVDSAFNCYFGKFESLEDGLLTLKDVYKTRQGRPMGMNPFFGPMLWAGSSHRDPFGESVQVEGLIAEIILTVGNFSTITTITEEEYQIHPKAQKTACEKEMKDVDQRIKDITERRNRKLAQQHELQTGTEKIQPWQLKEIAGNIKLYDEDLAKLQEKKTQLTAKLTVKK